MRTILFTLIATMLLTAAPIHKPALAPVKCKRDIIVCGNNWPPCMSDASGNCSGCGAK